MRGLLEETTEELERLRELAESRGDQTSLRGERERRQAEEPGGENETASTSWRSWWRSGQTSGTIWRTRSRR